MSAAILVESQSNRRHKSQLLQSDELRADRAGVRTTHVCLLVLFQVTDVVYMKKHTSPKLVLGVCLGGKEQGGAEGRWGGGYLFFTPAC